MFKNTLLLCTCLFTLNAFADDAQERYDNYQKQWRQTKMERGNREWQLNDIQQGESLIEISPAMVPQEFSFGDQPTGPQAIFVPSDSFVPQNSFNPNPHNNNNVFMGGDIIINNDVRLGNSSSSYGRGSNIRDNIYNNAVFE